MKLSLIPWSCALAISLSPCSAARADVDRTPQVSAQAWAIAAKASALAAVQAAANYAEVMEQYSRSSPADKDAATKTAQAKDRYIKLKATVDGDYDGPSGSGGSGTGGSPGGGCTGGCGGGSKPPELKAEAAVWAEASKEALAAAIQATTSYVNAMHAYSTTPMKNAVMVAQTKKADDTLAQLKALANAP